MRLYENDKFICRAFSPFGSGYIGTWLVWVAPLALLSRAFRFAVFQRLFYCHFVHFDVPFAQHFVDRAR